MKPTFILASLILCHASVSKAEIWKCQREGSQSASYTDTPTGEPGVNCEKAETIRFTKSEGQSAPRPAAASRSYSPPPTHVITQVKAKVKAITSKKPPSEEKSRASSRGSGSGNHPSHSK